MLSHRRELIQLAGTVFMIGLIALGLPVGLSVGVFITATVIAGLDILLLIVGRFSPQAILWAYRVEEWLGPSPWKRND